MRITPGEILETIRMVQLENLDIRTITMGISLRDCAHPEMERVEENIYNKIISRAKKLVSVANEIQETYGIPIINKRISVTPMAIVAESCQGEDFTPLAQALDRAAAEVGVDFIGGFSALVEKGFTWGDQRLIHSLPQALSQTKRVCASVNVASTKAGINMDAVRLMGQILKQAAHATADKDGVACAKLVVFANVPEDNPFMAGAFHGVGEAETVIHVGVSGPGAVLSAIKNRQIDDFGQLTEAIKRAAFKVTRMGELVGREASQRLGVEFGIVDLSLAPTPAVGDSVAEILEAMGLERCGAPGTTAALALLNDAVKKGGSMATSYVGGLSGAFIPVSEDQAMVQAVEVGALSLEKLEAMTAVCSVGLDMVCLPGDTPAETLSGIIADEAAIGVINHKTTAVRAIPVPGKKAGEYAHFGGLLGASQIMSVSAFSSKEFVQRRGRIPAPLQSLHN